jgi:hypothetical protein
VVIRTLLNKASLMLVGLFTLVVGPLSAQSADICWVERVKRTSTGIDAYFMDGRTVTVMRGNRLVGRYQTYSARTTIVRQFDGVTPVEAVPARLNDRLFSSNSPHDSCSLTVVLRNGKIGLEAKASMQLGVEPPTSAKKFMPAE